MPLSHKDVGMVYGNVDFVQEQTVSTFNIFKHCVNIWNILIVAMLMHFLWNDYDRSDFMPLFVTAGLLAFQEIIHRTWGQKNLGPKKYIWHFAQKFVVTLVSSGNEVHIPWLLNSKELFHTCKPLFSVFSKTARVFSSALTMWKVKAESWLTVHGWFPLPERLAELSNLLGNTGEILVQGMIREKAFCL